MLFRPAFSEEFERAEEELQKLYDEYFIHIRCLDALRAQMNINTKATQPISDITSKSSAPSMLLPDGILDFSDDLSNDGDDLLDDEAHELKLKRSTDTNRDVNDTKIESKVEAEAGKSKLRIKTGGLIEFFIS